MEELRKFVAPEFLFGYGARLEAGHYAANYGISRALVVSDSGVIQAGWTGQVCDQLKQAGIASVVFAQVTPNPKDHEVHAGLEVYQKEDCNGVVAVGGGSVLDCAKGIAILATNGRRIADYEGVDKIESPCPPLICVATTAGSAADVSQFAIITHTERRVKMAIISKALVPDVALIDPETTFTMDPQLTAHTALDALTHAFEAGVSDASAPITDLLACSAVRRVRRYLVNTLDQPRDHTARKELMQACLEAGLAFSNASLGAVHAMAHALGGVSNQAHGECNALLLPYVVRRNLSASVPAYQRLAEAFGCQLEARASAEAVRDSLLPELQSFIAACKVKTRLRDLPLDRSLIPKLAAVAVADPCLITNPVKLSEEELAALYDEAY
ncbi:MAG TPA: iron-containing alcohol dehydrogenase [Candidatus Ozemobacteraceae bacterium]|nr:iron-containing alcohol dehydrogenase [Candidatus Ozemobacteraceae bacterium]